MFSEPENVFTGRFNRYIFTFIGVIVCRHQTPQGILYLSAALPQVTCISRLWSQVFPFKYNAVTPFRQFYVFTLNIKKAFVLIKDHMVK